MKGISFEFYKHPRYKYKLTAPHTHQLKHYNGDAADIGWAKVEGGYLHIAAGYAWDGASGAMDSMSFARASLVHDSLYQLIAAGLLSKKPWKKFADKELVRIARQDGMGGLRSRYVYAAVRLFGSAKDKYQL